MHRNVAVGTLFVVLLAGVMISVSSLRAAGQAEEICLTGCLKAREKDGDFVLVIDEKEKHQVQAGERCRTFSALEPPSSDHGHHRAHGQ